MRRPCSGATRPQTGPADPEAVQLLQDLQELLKFLGQAYIESSGHAAAAQHVVADLQSALAFLHTRIDADTPPEPWKQPNRGNAYQSPTVSSVARQGITQTAQAYADASPSPTIMRGRSESPSASTTAAGESTPAPTGLSHPSSRPPLSSSKTPTVRGPSPGRTPASAATPVGRRVAGSAMQTPTSAAGAGRPPARSASPSSALARPVIASGAGRQSPSAASTTPPPAPRTHQAPPAASPIGEQPAPGPVPGLGLSPMPAVAQQALAAAQANAAMTAMTGGQAVGQSTPTPTKPLGPPQMPPAWRQSVSQYSEALQTGARLLAGPSPRHPGYTSLEHMVTSAADDFTRTLSAHYGPGLPMPRPTTDTDAAQAMPEGMCGANIAASQRIAQAQVKFSSCVAAQTWLLQALAQIGEGAGGAGPVPTADVARLVEGVAAARMQLQALLSQEQADTEDAAVLWRNRFMRAVVADMKRAVPNPVEAVGAATAAARAGTGPMRRPLGIWLPEDLWDAAPSAPACEAAAVPAWSVGLAQRPGSGFADARPAVLRCTGMQDACAHTLTALTLQASLFQLGLEGAAAAPLIPEAMPPPPQSSSGRSRSTPLQAHQRQAEERYLARFRVALQLLLRQGAAASLGAKRMAIAETMGLDGDEDDGMR